MQSMCLIRTCATMVYTPSGTTVISLRDPQQGESRAAKSFGNEINYTIVKVRLSVIRTWSVGIVACLFVSELLRER